MFKAKRISFLNSLMLIAGGAILLVASAGAEIIQASTICTAVNYQKSLSPNKAWTATVYENQCEGDYAFETTVLAKVIIASTSNTSNVEKVYVIDDGGNSGERPTIKWLDSTHLQISTVHSNYISIQKNYFSGITIQYKYD